MRKSIPLLLSCVLFFNATTFGKTIFYEFEEKNDTINVDLSKTKIGRYLAFMQADSINSSTLIFATASYTVADNSKSVFIGNLQPTLGINIARFFSKKFHLGLSINLGVIKIFNYTNFTSNFQKELNNSSNKSISNNANYDSSKIQLFKNYVSNLGVSNNAEISYGLSFAPYPNEFGGLMFEFKYGGHILTLGDYTKKGDQYPTDVQWGTNLRY